MRYDEPVWRQRQDPRVVHNVKLAAERRVQRGGFRDEETVKRNKRRRK